VLAAFVILPISGSGKNVGKIGHGSNRKKGIAGSPPEVKRLARRTLGGLLGGWPERSRDEQHGRQLPDCRPPGNYSIRGQKGV
jgi:hypothetical protein